MIKRIAGLQCKQIERIDNYRIFVSQEKFMKRVYFILNGSEEYLVKKKCIALNNNEFVEIYLPEIEDENYAFIVYRGKIFKFDELYIGESRISVDKINNNLILKSNYIKPIEIKIS